MQDRDDAAAAANDEQVDIDGAPSPAEATPDEDRKYNQRSVERVVSILNVLQESVDGMTLVEISRAVSLAKASTFRYLWTLEKHRYVEREQKSGRYRLGLGFVGMQSRDVNVLKERARPFLEQLRDETGETANLGMLEGDTVIYLDIVESGRGVRLARAHGDRDPLYCTALGKAIASQLPEAQVREILGRTNLVALTDNTITSVEQYLDELAKVRERGFAIDDRENDIDGRCVAAPILGTRLPAALSLSAPASRFPIKEAERAARTLVNVARQVASDRSAGRAEETT